MRTFQDLRHGYARAEPSLDRRLIVRGQGGENPVTERIRHLWSDGTETLFEAAKKRPTLQV
jgi:hypothetical protein